MSNDRRGENHDHEVSPADRQRLALLMARLYAAPGWMVRNKLISGLLVISVLFGTFLVGPHLWTRVVNLADNSDYSVMEALRRLDEGRYVQARQIARQLRRYASLSPDQEVVTDFVLGAAAAYEAERVGDLRFQSRICLPAAGYLESARVHTLPSGREAEALYLLGKCLYWSRQYARSLPVLKDALATSKHHAAEIAGMLAAAYFYDTPAQLEHALEYNQKHLANASLTVEQRAEGMFLEARILMAMRRLDQAIEIFNETIEFHSKDPATYQAIERLYEVVQRYPTAIQAVESCYLMAEAHRLAVRLPLAKSGVKTIETTHSALNHQVQKGLNAALAEYTTLQEVLSRREDQKASLTQLEQSILRNCYFARGSVLYDLNRYEESIKVYSTTTDRYQHEPNSIEAFVQIANCYRQLDQPVEARGTIEQAKIILSRIDPDAPFERTTRYTRDGWIRFLDWLVTL